MFCRFFLLIFLFIYNVQTEDTSCPKNTTNIIATQITSQTKHLNYTTTTCDDLKPNYSRIYIQSKEALKVGYFYLCASELSFYCWTETEENFDFASGIDEEFNLNSSITNFSNFKSCFKSKNDYEFIGNNSIRIKNHSLTYLPNKTYRFLINATEVEHYGLVIDVKVKPDDLVLNLDCQNEWNCEKHAGYIEVYPLKPFGLIGRCLKGCDKSIRIKYELSLVSTNSKTILKNLEISDPKSFEFETSLTPGFLSSVQELKEINVSLELSVDYAEKDTKIITRSLTIKIKQLPEPGECALNLTNGIALQSLFTVECTKWNQNNAFNITFEYFVQYENSSRKIYLGYSFVENFTFIMPQGKPDTFNLYFSMNVIYEWIGVLSYNLTRPIRVVPDINLVLSSLETLRNDEENNVVKCAQILISISSVLKFFHHEIKLNKRYKRENYGQSKKYSNQAAFNAKGKMLGYMKSQKPKSVNEVKTMLSALTEITKINEQISMSEEETIFNISENLFEKVRDSNNTISTSEIGSISVQFFEILGNILDSIEYTRKVSEIFGMLIQMMSAHSQLNEVRAYSTDVLEIRFFKAYGKDIKQMNQANESKIAFSRKFCQIFSVQQNVTNCEEKIIVQQITEFKNSMPGENGNSECDTSMSSSLGLKFAEEKSSQEIPISDDFYSIKMWIPRDNSNSDASFHQFNANQFNLYVFNKTFFMNSTNSSMHIHLKPVNLNISYLVNLTFLDENTYTYFKCPKDLTKDSNDDLFYSIFVSNEEISNYKGQVNLSIEELSSQETLFYCANNQTVSGRETRKFENNFFLRAFTSGCYYYDLASGVWSSHGAQVLNDSNFTHAHCQTKHLTNFAGGFLILPLIDFQAAFENSSFAQNKTVYILVIVLVLVYVLLALLAFRLDKKDKKKINSITLFDPSCLLGLESYFYELNLFTGTRKDSHTDSQVSFMVASDMNESAVYRITSINQSLFRRAGIDSFIFNTEKPLGNLNYLKIGHDNSGVKPCWFLKHAIVRDLQTDEKFYFKCQRWFSTYRNDECVLDRILPVANKSQMKDFKYFLNEKTKAKLIDGHLWLSVFIKPTQSSFSRVDRVTCSFSLLFLSMLMSLLYYDAKKNEQNEIYFQLNIGPFRVTTVEIVVAFLSNLIIIPVNVLLIQLFKRSKKRVNKKKASTFLFPWWCKIAAYIVSLIISSASIFFIIIKGINLGDEVAKKWLGSILSSLLISIIITQPLQIILLSLLIVSICGSLRNVEIFDKKEDMELNRLKNDLETTSNESSKNFTFTQFLPSKVNLDAEKTSENKLRNFSISSVLRMIVLNVFFICLLISVANSTHSEHSFHCKNYFRKLFEYHEKKGKTIQHVNEVWDWTNNTLISILNDLNNRNISNNFLFGYVYFIQTRDDLITISKNQIESKLNLSLDSEKFLGAKNERIETLKNMSNLNYMKTDELNAFFDVLNSYESNEIAQESSNLDQLRSKIGLLKFIYWLDSQTKTFSIRFTTINPNLNMYSLNTIKFNFVSIELIQKELTFRAVEITQNEFQQRPILLVSKMALFATIIYLLIREILSLVKNGFRKYFQLGSLFEICLDWMIFILFLASFVFYVCRQIITDKTLEYLAVLDESIRACLAFCVSLAFLKLLKLISFNKQVFMLANNLRCNFHKLAGFTLLFLASFFSFVQMIFLMNFDASLKFSTFSKTTQTCFLTILGKFDFDAYFTKNKLLAHFVFIAFNFIIVMVLLTLFFSILNESLRQIKNDSARMKIDLCAGLANFMSNKKKKLRKKSEKENLGLNGETYLRTFKHLQVAFDSLLAKILNVKKEQEIFNVVI